ncbi:MAG: ATP-binding protein [Proteobacteria bacterium]|uniref:ATP-binding protein n=1 Tax=Candidatus Avisuccinivibrio stercorigallinarum TaxID=2840704 RepID=A0A9D9DBB7_9GAMM|nr:ATP-binding protein [Candidatus Avisuccinivibrio stercorigallinarum]
MASNVSNILGRMGLYGAKTVFDSYTPQDLSKTPTEVVIESMLLGQESYDLVKKQTALLNLSRLNTVLTEDAITYDETRGPKFANMMSRLLSLDFIKKGQNVTMFGRSGAGKSTVAKIIGRKACMAGYTTLYYSTSDMLAMLSTVTGSQMYTSRLKNLCGKMLLILDDFCLTGYNLEEQKILFDVFNRRYSNRSTIIISQKTPDEWHDTMEGSSLAESIVDRASNNNFVLTLNGDSRRTSLDDGKPKKQDKKDDQKDAKDAGEPQAAPAAEPDTEGATPLMRELIMQRATASAAEAAARDAQSK